MCTLCQARDPSIEHYDVHGAENFSDGHLSVSSTRPVYSYDQIADYLTEGFWSDFGTVARHFSVQSGGTITYNLDGLTGFGAETARKALEAWTAVSGLQFQEVAGWSAQVVFDDNNSGAYAYSSVYNGHITKSHINVDAAWAQYGGYYYQTFMHEIGHALGLGHTGGYNGNADYARDAGYANDSWQTSVMSYFSQFENTWTDATRMYLATLQLGDIAAIHRLYGTPVNVEMGDTVYGDGETTGGRFGMDLAGSFAVAIVDSGGTDLIDLGSRGYSQQLSLVAETYSNINGRIGNFSIGRDTVIENVVTGSGNDIIVGNAADNRIESGAGDDTLIGGAGADILSGGSGRDVFVMRPGDGADIIIDFEPGFGSSGGDLIDITSYALSENQIQFSGSHAGLKVLLLSDSILLKGVSLDALAPSAFLGLVSNPEPEAGDVELMGVGLQFSARNAYQVVDGEMKFTVQWLGQTIGPDSLPGWKAIHAGSDEGGGYSLLWQHESGVRTIWALDSTGVRTGNEDMTNAVEYEERFAFDITGDGVIGYQLANIDPVGVALWSTTKNEYALSDGDGTAGLPVQWQGKTMGPDSLPGWQAIQAGSDGAGGYNLLWQHDSGARAIWTLDSTGVRTGSIDMANAIDYEARFAFDINADRLIGFGSDGDVGLRSTTANLYQIADVTGVTMVTLFGQSMGPDSLPGWQATRAASDGAEGYSLLWQHESGAYAIWDLNSAGERTGNADMANAIGYEDRFDFDLNGDGVIGHTLTDIELNGVELWSSTADKYLIGDDNSFVKVTMSGKSVGSESLAGWTAIQAGSDGGGGYNLLWRHESGDHAIWELDSSGARTGDVDMTNVIDYEAQFAFDLNGDGILGEWIV